MPPTVRPPTSAFRSLLLPAIRVRLRKLHSFVRPQCASLALRRAAPAAICPVQRRSLHLYKTAKAKTALGMHKVLDFDPYEIEPPIASKHTVNLVRSNKDPEVIAKDLTLQEVYDEHISPGHFLYMTEPIEKKLVEDYKRLREVDLSSQNNNYAIVKAHTVKVNIKNPQTDGKQLGPLKGINLLLSSPVPFTKEVLDRAYQFIDAGSPVEFRMRLFSSAMSKKGKVVDPDPGAWPWFYEHFPHLRPDFIRKSMPKGTKFLVKPFSDGRCVQFVLCSGSINTPGLDLTTRLLRVKRAVEASVDRNPMAQMWLNKKVRKAKIVNKGVGSWKEAERDVQSELALEKERLKQVIADNEIGTRGRLDLSKGGQPRKAAKIKIEKRKEYKSGTFRKQY